jgi:hypothetical protein
MKNKKWLLASALSALAAMSTAGNLATAQQGGPIQLESVDTNGDGTVTVAELVASLLTRWTESDTNQDGKVTADELKAQRTAEQLARFAKEDTNGNGVLERSEVAHMPDAMFAKLDADASGTLTQAELENGHPGPKGRGPDGGGRGVPGDTDHDGAVSQAEATAEDSPRASMPMVTERSRRKS